MKYLARALLMLAIVAVSLVAFTSATSVQAGSGGVHIAFHCQGPDVWGNAVVQVGPFSPQLANLTCNSVGDRVVNNDPFVSTTSYWVTLTIYQLGMPEGSWDLLCQQLVDVGTHFSCDSPVTPAHITLQIR